MNYIDRIAKLCLDIARKDGFSPLKEIENLREHRWYLASGIAGIHSEASEMYEALRENSLERMAKEGIDVLIRTLVFLSNLKGIDIEGMLREKMEINKGRSYMHGGKLL